LFFENDGDITAFKNEKVSLYAQFLMLVKKYKVCWLLLLSFLKKIVVRSSGNRDEIVKSAVFVPYAGVSSKHRTENSIAPLQRGFLFTCG